MNRDDPLVETAILGKEAEAFLGTEIGKYLLARAELEIAQATRELKNVYPWRTRRIRELQNRIYRAESVRTWIEDVIEDGKAAYQTIEQEEIPHG